MLLVHFLRDRLGLTGTHVGCDTSNCGACTVHVDGESVKSCTLLAAQVDDAVDRRIAPFLACHVLRDGPDVVAQVLAPGGLDAAEDPHAPSHLAGAGGEA